MRIFSYFFLVFLLFGARLAMAQQPALPEGMMEDRRSAIDSLRNKQDSSKVQVIYNASYIKYTSIDMMKDSLSLSKLDTVKKDFRFSGTLSTPQRPTLRMSSYGLAQRAMMFEPNTNIGFQLGRNAWDSYLIQPQDVLYYAARVPYTEMQYVSGGSVEDLFRVTLAENLSKQLNIGLVFNRNSSDAFYQRQQTGIMGLSFFSWYRSLSNRYHLFTNYNINTLRLQENGGLQSSDIFSLPSNVPLSSLKPKLPSAYIQNRDVSFFVKQYFTLNKNVKDSSKVNKAKALSRVYHALTVRRQTFGFTSAMQDTSGVFSNYYINSSTTNDYTILDNYKNDVGYSFTFKSSKSSFLRNDVKVNLSLIHDFYRLQQMGNTSNLNNITARGDFGYNLSTWIKLNADVQQIFAGNQIGDYNYLFSGEFKVQSNVLNVRLNTVNQTPLQIYRSLVSNNLMWSNTFDKVLVNSLTAEFEQQQARLKLGFSYSLMHNYVYFKENASGEVLPYQHPDPINLLKFYIRKDFRFWRFNWENYGVYQVSDYLDELTTPEWYLWTSFYYKDAFLKNALKLSLGTDVTYYSKFSNPAYMPSLGQYYVSYNSTKMANMPVWSVWVSMGLRKANIFVTYEYLNQNMGGTRGYYLVSGYPMSGSMIRWGVIWRMFE